MNAPTAQPLDGRNVLIVEDRYIIASEMADHVGRLGGHVIGPSPSVAHAKQLLEQGRVDFALLDVNLNGELVFPLAEAMAERGVPFAFLTGYDELPAPWRGRPRLEKPVSARRLEELLAALG